MITFTEGYVIRSKRTESYYDINGIGDWSLAGTEESAQIFETESEAKEAMFDAIGQDNNYEVIHVHRLTAFYDKELTEEQLNKLREFMK